MDMAHTSVDYTASFAITGGELAAAENVAHGYASMLVEYIDQSLLLGTRHFRLKSGRLLRTLDEVVSAILNDELVW